MYCQSLHCDLIYRLQRLQSFTMPEYSIEEYADIFCMGNVAEMPMLLTEGMLMPVLWQTEDILIIYYEFFPIQIQINKVTQNLTNMIRVRARFQIPLEVNRDVVSQIKL
jgi:hypothetical protein